MKTRTLRSCLLRLVAPLAAGALLLVGAAGCNPQQGASTGSSGPAPAKPLKIGISFQEMENPYFVVMKQAIDEAAATLGAQVFATDARHDVTKQINDVQDLIQRNVDILILNPTDSVGVEGAVVEAKKAGIIVVAVDAQAKGPLDSFVGSKNYDAGFQAGEHLAKVLGDKGDVAILDGIPVVPILERVRGFKDAIAKHPGIKIVTTQNGKQERDTALTVTENIIQAHPGLAGLFSVNDTGSLGALSAIEASRKNIALVSVDGFSEAVDHIKKGGAFKSTSAQFPRDQIRIALGIALAKYWGANVPAEIPVDIKLITRENAEGFSW
ncbi:ABC-type sugar transport system, periplasmic component [Opitutaceae bacterium TAV1]|nr:LacI family transcriptional regulator [Opitutaceae bacterium TAV5]EIP98735.1 ABC-type sugar transport system, periplasmic component [Opitutaceae bacterium TAV1]